MKKTDESIHEQMVRHENRRFKMAYLLGWSVGICQAMLKTELLPIMRAEIERFLEEYNKFDQEGKS